MTFKTRFLILRGVAVFLSLTLVLGLVLQTIQRTPSREHEFLPANLDVQKLDRISIKHGADDLEIIRSQGNWMVAAQGDQLPARASRIDDLIKSLKSMRSQRIAAQTSQGWPELKIDDANASTLILEEGAQQTILRFGDVSLDGSEQYVREKAGPIVYAVKAGIAFWLQQPASYWLERKIWPDSLKPAEVLGISYQAPKTGVIRLTKQIKDGVDSWLPEGAKSAAVDKDRIAAWVQNLLTIEGDDSITLEADKVPTGYTAAGQISLNLQDDREFSVLVYAPAKQEDKWLVVPRYDGHRLSQAGRTIALLVPEWKLQRSVMGD